MSEPGTPSDSANVPFTGRVLPPTGFENDTGAADPAVRNALAAADEPAMMSALAASRFLVPIVADPTQVREENGLVVDTAVEMAVVTLIDPDGERALPVFTGADALTAWDDSARPVPVAAGTAAQAAIREGCSAMVVDIAGPEQVVLRPSMVWALATGREWTPPERDPFVRSSVQAAIQSDERIVDVELEAGEPEQAGILTVVLTLMPGLDHDGVTAVAQGLGERLATDGEFRARIDGLSFRIV